jgi:hypothetical protein
MSLVSDLAARPDFESIWNSGISLADIALRLGCNRQTAQKAARKLGLVHPTVLEMRAMDRAPSEAEELLSQASLDLAPTVAARAELIKQELFDSMREGRPSKYTLRRYRKQSR